jgi:hypothetical protein
MGQFIKKESELPGIDLMAVFYEHTCDAEDERDCSIMKHLILAEIRRSNAPEWVAEELEKKLSCPGCWNALAKQAVVYHGSIGPDRFSGKSKGYEQGKGAVSAKA